MNPPSSGRLLLTRTEPGMLSAAVRMASPGYRVLRRYMDAAMGAAYRLHLARGASLHTSRLQPAPQHELVDEPRYGKQEKQSNEIHGRGL